jgi:hypothetical protein
MFISVIERRAALDDAARGAWRGAADAFPRRVATLPVTHYVQGMTIPCSKFVHVDGK